MGGRGYVHTDIHKLSGRGGQFYTPAPSGLLPHANSTRPPAGAGQALPWLPPSPACSCHPLPGTGSWRVCRHHHNKPGGEGAQDEMLAGKFPLSSACSGWLALQSAAVYSPYKNIYIETACSYAYKANAFRLGQAPTPYSGAGNNPASQ